MTSYKNIVLCIGALCSFQVTQVFTSQPAEPVVITPPTSTTQQVEEMQKKIAYLENELAKARIDVSVAKKDKREFELNALKHIHINKTQLSEFRKENSYLKSELSRKDSDILFNLYTKRGRRKLELDILFGSD